MGAVFTAFSQHTSLQESEISHLGTVLRQHPVEPCNQPISKEGFCFEQGLQVAQKTVVFFSALLFLSSCLNIQGTAPSTRTSSSIFYPPDRAVITKSERSEQW